MDRTYVVTVEERVTYDFEIDLDPDLIDEWVKFEDFPLVLNLDDPDVIAEWLGVDSDDIANGCCDENFSGAEDREITDVRRVVRPFRKKIIPGEVVSEGQQELPAAS